MDRCSYCAHPGSLYSSGGGGKRHQISSQINHGPDTRTSLGFDWRGRGGEWSGLSGEGRRGGHLGLVEPPQLTRAQRQEGAEEELHCDGDAGEGDPEPLPEVEPPPALPGRRWRGCVPPVPVPRPRSPPRRRGRGGRGVGGRRDLPLRGGDRRGGRRGGGGGEGEGRGGEEEEREEEGGQGRGSGGCRAARARAWRHGRGRGIKVRGGGASRRIWWWWDWGRGRGW